MANQLTLLIMAAGMGSRFGGLKQLEPVGSNGEYIIDYSIQDAIKAGFNRVVIIIKEEHLIYFENTLSKRFAGIVDILYVFQKIDDLPEPFKCPKGRVKPWGTAHAVLAAQDVIKESFAVINADDYYGEDAFVVLANFLQKSKDLEFASVCYPVDSTLSDNGSVKRGIAFAENGKLIKLIESVVENKDGKIVAKPLSGDDLFVVSKDSLASVNMFGFTPDIFNYLRNKFINFLNNTNDLQNGEYLITEFLEEGLNDLWSVCVLTTTSKWYGITHREDLEKFKTQILIERK